MIRCPNNCMCGGQPYHFGPHRGPTISAALRRPTWSRRAPRLPSENTRGAGLRGPACPQLISRMKTHFSARKSEKVFIALSLQDNYLVIKRKANYFLGCFFLAKAPIWAWSSLGVRLWLGKHFRWLANIKARRRQLAAQNVVQTVMWFAVRILPGCSLASVQENALN